MFIILLKFSDNKDRAGALMDGHKAWVQRGFDEGIFLLSGSLRPEGGGAILAQEQTLAALQARVSDDPFVAENVVQAEIIEIAPSRTAAALDFLRV